MRSRSTLAGHVPTSWAKPHRSTIMMLAVAAAIADTFVWLTAPEGMLDAELVYGPAHVRTVLVALEEGGRRAYEASALVDLGFIVLYSILLANWIRFFKNRRVAQRWTRPWIGLLPGMFDLIETVGILVLLKTFPEADQGLVLAVVVATPLKWIGLAGTLVLIAGGEVAWWRRRARHRRQQRQKLVRRRSP